jgi:hypothetical protein
MVLVLVQYLRLYSTRPPGKDLYVLQGLFCILSLFPGRKILGIRGYISTLHTRQYFS